MKTMTRTGFWGDICVLPSGRFAHVVSDRSAVAVYDGAEEKPPVWRQALATDLLRFLRCACAPDGSIAAIGQAADGRALDRSSRFGRDARRRYRRESGCDQT